MVGSAWLFESQGIAYSGLSAVLARLEGEAKTAMLVAAAGVLRGDQPELVLAGRLDDPGDYPLLRDPDSDSGPAESGDRAPAHSPADDRIDPLRS